MQGFNILYAFVCEDVRQEIDGKVTYVGQADVLNVKGFPVIFPCLCLVYATGGRAGKYKAKLIVRNSESKEVLAALPEHPVELAGEGYRLREVYQLHNLKVEKPGKYDIEIIYDEKIIHSFDLIIRVPSPADQKAPSAVSVVLSNN
jgi:hypothetical protein